MGQEEQRSVSWMIDLAVKEFVDRRRQAKRPAARGVAAKAHTRESVVEGGSHDLPRMR